MCASPMSASSVLGGHVRPTARSFARYASSAGVAVAVAELLKRAARPITGMLSPASRRGKGILFPSVLIGGPPATQRRRIAKLSKMWRRKTGSAAPRRWSPGRGQCQRGTRRCDVVLSAYRTSLAGQYERLDPSLPGAIFVFIPSRIEHNAFRPDVVAFGGRGRPGDSRPGVAADGDRRFGVGLEVVVPARVLGRSPVGRDDAQPAGVGNADYRDRAGRLRLGPDRGQDYRRQAGGDTHKSLPAAGEPRDDFVETVGSWAKHRRPQTGSGKAADRSVQCIGIVEGLDDVRLASIHALSPLTVGDASGDGRDVCEAVIDAAR